MDRHLTDSVRVYVYIYIYYFFYISTRFIWDTAALYVMWVQDRVGPEGTSCDSAANKCWVTLDGSRSLHISNPGHPLAQRPHIVELLSFVDLKYQGFGTLRPHWMLRAMHVA